MKKKYVGLVGPICSGMWAVVEVLEEMGFKYYRLSDRIREVSQAQGIPDSRENWQQVGDELREKHGPDVLAKKTVDLVNEDQHSKIIIDSIRHPLEVDHIKSNLDALLIGVDAPVEVRFELMKIRKRDVDPMDFEEFKRLDEYERDNQDDISRQSINKSLSMVDILFEHNGDLEKLKSEVKERLLPLISN